MCGRYTQTIDPGKLALRFGLDPPRSNIVSRYNIAPTQDAPVVANDDPKRLRLMRWGLTPAWAKAVAIGNRMINARAELVNSPKNDSPACIAPA
ncbi:MAG TPA: hypothetical protein DCZ01_04675 [Elusimicrobia bacterium]|nr:hypothetical protein [Elusimicrobiota bacterium]